jgi:hypothetical protein
MSPLQFVLIETLNRIKPDVPASYPFMLHPAAFAAVHGELDIAPRLMFLAAEPLLPEIRTRSDVCVAVPLINVWAATETIRWRTRGKWRRLSIGTDPTKWD